MDDIEIPPNKTIYINNLNEKIKKQELRKSLYAMFSQFGTVLDVVALKTLRMRGQAFIVFKDLTAATSAKRSMQNFPFYDKPMKIQFSRTKSDVIAKIDGTYQPHPKTSEKLAQIAAVKRKAEDASAAEVAKKQRQEEKKQAATKAKPEKAKPAAAAPGKAAASAPAAAGGVNLTPKVMPPNKILFVENLPEGCTDMMLSMLFQQFPGYREARLVPSKAQTVAFVEFDNEIEAGVALAGLQHFKITPTNLMVISYAKK
eukprot:TRINITY_DN3686_c0_g1_i1.p1 TRINITY_DN3686_c0_g1~~TRINITY_DN3686_c0_g1_i1.p1  ORF type:complete len:258 (-),score=53.76 TRINITY_DN3686_c0_g1_i1:139-912(-)